MEKGKYTLRTLTSQLGNELINYRSRHLGFHTALHDLHQDWTTTAEWHCYETGKIGIIRVFICFVYCQYINAIAAILASHIYGIPKRTLPKEIAILKLA